MKKSALIFVIVGCVFGVMAQQRVETAAEEPEGYEYVPIVREGVEWGYEWSIPTIYGKTSSYYIQFKGEAIIDGKTYKKCYRYNSMQFSKENGRLAGFAREEDKKVYAIIKLNAEGEPYGSDKEQLIYDFNAPKGTDVIINGLYCGTVSRIEYVKIRNQWRKAVYLSMGEDNPSDFLYAVEGLGIVHPSESYLLYPFPDRQSCTLCFTAHLNYVSNYPQCEGYEYNADFEYRYDEDYDNLEMGGVETVNAATEGLLVTQGDGWLRVSVDCDCYRRAELTDAKGMVVDAVTLQGETEVEFQTVGFAAGVYVVSLFSDTEVHSIKVLIKN